jgi:E3 ubiquitin-protein ligase CHFR
MHLAGSPTGFAPLFEAGLFDDPPPSAAAGGAQEPRRICRSCAGAVLLWGVRSWWVRERVKGEVPAAMLSRPDCVDGRACLKQRDLAHARECELSTRSVSCNGALTLRGSQSRRREAGLGDEFQCQQL